MSLSTAHTTLLDELDALAPQLLLVLGGTGLGKTTVLRSLIRRWHFDGDAVTVWRLSAAAAPAAFE